MKQLFFSVLMLAVTTVHAGEVVADSPIKNVLLGNSIGWRVKRGDDNRSISVAKWKAYVTPTDLVLET